MLDWLIKKFRAKGIKKHNGMVIFYTVYKPQNPVPNVISRRYYEGKPELLEEMLKAVK
jgi:hypothetical protein